MPSYDPELFNVDPYYDDYDQNKKYLKMLFRPGYALQARELTQIQTILQNQIERFGNFVFDDGSIVYGGQITEIPTKTGYLNGLSGAGASPSDLTDKVIEIQSNDQIGYAKIIYGMTEERSSGGTYNVAFFQPISGVGLTQGTIRGTLNGLEFTATLADTVENSLVVFVDEGIRYTNGYFVMNDPQRIGLFERDPVNPDIYTYSNVSSSVGFDVNRSIVTSQEDETLKDPANGSYNFNAPGADRFKIDLKISQKSLTGTEESIVTDPFSRTNFIEFIRVFNGNVVKKEKYADLGALEDTLARRTYDESGNYVVDPFELSVTENTNTNLLNARLDTGKAYIFGYEFETQGSISKTFRKARDAEHISEEIGFDLPSQVGPYTLVKFTGIPGYAAGLSFGYGLSAYHPTIYFDSSNGFPSGQITTSPIDSVRFVIQAPGLSGIPAADTFVPGLTLYAWTDPNGGENGTADAEILGKIRSINTDYSETSSYFATIEVVPPFERGLTAISQGLTFPNGLTSFFTADTFYVSGGPTFEGGNTSQVFSVNGDTVEFFRSINQESITGGAPVNIFGSAKIKNIQILSGDTYKLFLGDINIPSNRSFSDIKRYYLGGEEQNSYYQQPTFFTAEPTTSVYSPSGESLVYYSNFDDEINRFTNIEFAIDTIRVVSSQQFNPGLGNPLDSPTYPYIWIFNMPFSGDGSVAPPNGSDEWGLNYSQMDVAIPVSNSNFITIFNEDGPIDALYRLRNNPTDLLELFFKEVPKQPFTVITSHIVDPLSGNASRRKVLIENAYDETNNVLNFFSGIGEDEGYWVSYLKNNTNNFESDVYEIVSFTSEGANVPFEFDSGQKDSYYDFSKVKIKKTAGILNGNPANTELATYEITYKKFVSSGNGPFIGGNEGPTRSYFMAGQSIDGLSGNVGDVNDQSAMPFELIPSFTSKDGKLINLRNAIDFRPIRIGNTDTFSLLGPYDQVNTNDKRIVSSHPYSGFGNNLEYKSYLSRIDKIFLNKNKTFSLVEGIPASNPQSPSDNPDSMTLYSIVVNPYTFNENDVTIKQENNRRYTMRDIGELEKRIEKIEYYSTLNSLELEAKSHPIYDSFGLELPKKAVLADQFTNANSSDVLNKDFTMSINKDMKELKPNFDLYENSSITTTGSLSSSISVESGLTYDSESKVVTFDYTLTPYLENTLANSSRKINSNSIVNYSGSLKISPHCDKWFDTGKTPVVKMNIDGSNDYWYSENPFTRNDAFWDYNWFGKENSNIDKNFRKNTPKRNFDQTTKPISENKVGSFFSSDSNSFTYNEKVLERSIAPYVRGRTITLQAKGLKPNTDHYIYFDNVLQTQGDGLPETVTTDEYGEFNGTLTITAGTYLSGKKLIRITDTQINPNDLSDLGNSSSSADAVYTVLGNPRDQNSLQFIKPITTRRESSDSQNITSNAVTRDFQRSQTKSRSVKDTLTQTFTVDYSRFKSGMFIKQIDVFLDGYPTSASSSIGSSVTSKLPIRLQLKPIVSGYPNISKVIAESFVYDVDSDPNVETINNFSEDIVQVKKVKFVFDYPVYLPPGDYAFSLDSNSDEYSVVTYILPSIQKDADKSSQDSNVSSLFGSLFLPKNVGSFEKITNEFITTSIHRCKFDPNATGTKRITKTLFNSSTTINEFRLSADYVEPVPNTLNIKIGDNANVIKITPNKTINFDNTTESVFLEFVPVSGQDAVSPVLDLSSLNTVYTKYKLPNLNSSEEVKPRFLGSDPESGSRYISKTVNLERPARNVVVRFDKIEPPSTAISVYLKYKTPGSELGMSEIPYVSLSSITNVGKTPSNSYSTDEYTYSGTLPEISSFSVKIVFSSTLGEATKVYPKIKNLTITAV